MTDRIPEGWRECKLGEAPLDIIDGDRGINYPKQNEFNETGYCLFLNTKNVTSNGFVFEECYFITKEKDGKLGKGKLQKNDIVLTTRGTVGNIAFYSDAIPFNNIRINSGMVIIRPKIEQISPEYTYQLLKNLKYEYNIFATGSAQPQLPIRDLINIPILLPPLPEQRAIASVLGSLDDKIDLLNRENHTLEQMAEALFRQWFIEEADEKWEEGTIANMIDILPGFPFKSDLFTELGKYCLITIKSVQDGHLDISKTDKINDIPSRMPNYCYLKPGDILLSLTGNVGRCCLVDVNNALLNQRVAKLFAKNSRDMAYTYIYFRMEKTKRLLEEMAKGTAQPNLSPVETLRIKMRIPPKSKLELFSSKSNPIIKRILCNKMQIRTLEKLRDTLLPKLMSREVRVKL